MISSPAISTVLVGMATPDEFTAALEAIEKGPLSAAALTRLTTLQAGFVGEGR